jgi:hypothetical protein
MGKASRKFKQRGKKPRRVWTPWKVGDKSDAPPDWGSPVYNSLYQVWGRVCPVKGLVIDGREVKEMIHLSIKTNDRSPVIDWRDKLRIKNELCGEDAEAVELYPAMSRVVDGANQFHLWVIGYTGGPRGANLTDADSAGVEWPFGFKEGQQVFDQHNSPTRDKSGRLKQRKVPEWMKSRESLDQSIAEARSELTKEGTNEVDENQSDDADNGDERLASDA